VAAKINWVDLVEFSEHSALERRGADFSVSLLSGGKRAFLLYKKIFLSTLKFSQKEKKMDEMKFSLRFSNQSYISYGTSTPTNSSYSPPASEPSSSWSIRRDDNCTYFIQWKNFSLPFWVRSAGATKCWQLFLISLLFLEYLTFVSFCGSPLRKEGSEEVVPVSSVAAAHRGEVHQRNDSCATFIKKVAADARAWSRAQFHRPSTETETLIALNLASFIGTRTVVYRLNEQGPDSASWSSPWEKRSWSRLTR